MPAVQNTRNVVRNTAFPAGPDVYLWEKNLNEKRISTLKFSCFLYIIKPDICFSVKGNSPVFFDGISIFTGKHFCFIPQGALHRYMPTEFRQAPAHIPKHKNTLLTSA